ncbi:carbon-nitrogen hydrolase family protein [Enterobacter sp. Ap-916]|uniref:carbon-nitrogen hydrolase family protein n=2 Tax=Enterobacteriaceae TaxID=543 RepID=UPI00142231D6|nr:MULTISPECIES: carbon-nitrogen hydrolase family protein [unclassified Enterobacter]NIF58982.1 carbon-nitrogen hydrolase family protein [Enterobacter sp. Ap-867]NIG29602.1 carbon-nitrogen hydrolase family protein [Enterobacter sp. Ap-916]
MRQGVCFKILADDCKKIAGISMNGIRERLSIAAGQFAPVRGNIEENMRCHELLITLAASADVNLIIFPELSLTGYEPELAGKLALIDESCLQPLQALADRHEMTIVAGAPLYVQDNKPAIGACVISAGQPISYYRKMYLHPGESDYFSSGTAACVITARTFNVGVAICADAGQPRHVEQTVQIGAEIYINSVLSAGGYEKDTDVLKSYAKFYAMPTLMANYCGNSGGWKPVGKSAAWNAKGELIAQAPEDRDALVIMDFKDGECAGRVIYLS